MSFHEEPAYADGEAVETVEPDIYFDDPPSTEPERDASAMEALLAVVFQLGQWSGRDKVKEYACRVVMRQTAQCPKLFAQENKVSESFVFRRIREARAQIGSPAKDD